MLKINLLVAILAYMVATQMVETAPAPKQLLRFQPITQQQYERIMIVTDGKPVISEERLVEIGIKSLSKFGTSPSNTWKTLLNRAGLEVFQQKLPEDGEIAGYPLCVIKTKDLEAVADDATEETERKRPVVKCIVVVRPQEYTNADDSSDESEQPEKPEKSEKPEEPEKPEKTEQPENSEALKHKEQQDEGVTVESSKTPVQSETPKYTTVPQQLQKPVMPVNPMLPFNPYYGFGDSAQAALASLPYSAYLASYPYLNYGFAYPYPMPMLPQPTPKPKKKKAQHIVRNAANAVISKQFGKGSTSSHQLRQGYPGYPPQPFNPFINPAAYPNPQYTQPGFSAPYALPGQQFPQQIPPPFPQQFPQHFPQQYPQQFPQQYPQQFSQQFPQQFPQAYPQPFPPQFPPQFPHDAPQKPATNSIEKRSHADIVADAANQDDSV